MSPSPIDAYRPGILVTVAFLVLSLSGSSCAHSKGDEKKEDLKPAAHVTEPSLCRPFESGSAGYSLRCPKRPDPYRGTNTGLQATYQFGDAAPKQAEVFEDATSWLVHIPDHMRPGDEVRVSLSFLYSPSVAAQQALRDELKTFSESIVNDVTQALRDHGEEWTTKLSVNPNATQYSLLESARSKEGLPAIVALLKGLGFTQVKESEAWKPTEDTLRRLNEAAQEDTKQGMLTKSEMDTALKSAQSCEDLLGKRIVGTSKEMLKGAAECLEKASAEAANEAAKAKATVPPGQQSTIDATECQKLIPDPATLAAFNEAIRDNDTLAMITKLDDAQKNGEKVCAEATINQLGSVSSLLALSRHVNAINETENALKRQLNALAAALVVTIDTYPRDQLLAADAERRGYSLSSGAIYLNKLNDLVYPVLVSVCPAGCLRGNEQFWAADKGFRRSFSLEVGIAAITADKFDDARKRGGPGFLLGASWQALAPFKLSAGTLFFENMENRNWQFDGYLGVTLDAANAIEMMGLFGVSVPVQLKSVGSQPTP